MKLIDFKNAAFNASVKASDINRQLAFAGIAVCWIFKNDAIGILQLPNQLILPLSMFVVALSLDLIQYIFKTIVWSIFWRTKENKPGVTMDSEFKAHVIWSTIVYILFGLKIVTNITGYILLINYLFSIILW